MIFNKIEKLLYGKQYGYEVLFKRQTKKATGKTGVIIAEMGLPEVYEADFYKRFMSHVFEYIMPSFLAKLILVDKGMGLIDPSNPLAREEFNPELLIDSQGSVLNKAGVPYIECEYIWKKANLKNPWDHGYFLYRGDGPSGNPDIIDKVGARVVGWYYGKLIPEKKVAWRQQLDILANEAINALKINFPEIEFQKAFYMDIHSLSLAVENLLTVGCETIVYQSINCPIYTDFEDYGYALPLLHQLINGRAKIIMTDQLGNQPDYREAYFQILRDQLLEIDNEKSVLVILSSHGHPFKKETMDDRAHLYRRPLEEGMRAIMADRPGRWDVIWSYDEYADSYWDKNNQRLETYNAYLKAIEEGYDYAIELPTEFPAENTDLMIFHAMKKFRAFPSYDRNDPVPYPDWEKPLVRKFTSGKTTGIYAGTPVGPYRKHLAEAIVNSLKDVLKR
ncbi:MAG: hypothetical protein BGO78_02835 [Chloroflexi bacterium 44-23]|nr:MAG: hypothetical protein BGO78_02835 [Chloroflexi bacterium 44-23]